ncbi:MAG: GNAT family N-acetyltransferase [Anaerolineae bacterium]
MNPIIRPYDPADRSKMLAALGTWNAEADGCGLLHPGDVLHGMSNGLRGGDPTHWFALAENESGELRGLAMVFRPQFTGFEVCVAPTERGGAIEEALIDWAEARTWEVMQAAGVAKSTVHIDIMECDPVRQQLMEARGYRNQGIGLISTTQTLRETLPDVPLPAGYHFSTAADLDDPDAIGECHASAFGSSWPPGAYSAVMATPGFDSTRELLVVAPDGRPAAFTVWWPDPISRSALFEPVGCAAEFQRRGLTKALLVEGMRRMQAAGMATAIVNHEPPNENPASAALYASVGFAERHMLFRYSKAMR